MVLFLYALVGVTGEVPLCSQISLLAAAVSWCSSLLGLILMTCEFTLVSIRLVVRIGKVMIGRPPVFPDRSECSLRVSDYSLFRFCYTMVLISSRRARTRKADALDRQLPASILAVLDRTVFC